MLRKTLLTTASVVVATCGAMTTAQAGILKLRLHNVNLDTCDNNKPIHFDQDCKLKDKNGRENPGLNFLVPSVDKGIVPDPEKPDFKHAVIAAERYINDEFPASGLYEIDISEVSGLATFAETVDLEINLSGSADPWFKEDANCGKVLRPGKDNVFSRGARSLDGGGIKVDTNTAICRIDTYDDGQFSDASIGLALPIKTKECGDLTVEVIVWDVDGPDRFNPRPSSHTIQTCEPSIYGASGVQTVKIDYLYGFRTFLVDDEYTPYPDHTGEFWADTGFIRFDLKNHITNLKANAKTDIEDYVLDAGDFEKYELVVQFGDLQGIKDVKIRKYGDSHDQAWHAYLDRENDRAVWANVVDGPDTSLDTDKLCWGDETLSAHMLTEDEGCELIISVHAYAREYKGAYWGPIDHQEGVISSSKFFLEEYEQGPNAHPVPFQSPIPVLEGATVAHLQKTGIVFGPFDWVADPDSQVRSVFRVTGIPMDRIDDLKGHIIVSNASGGSEYDRLYKVDYVDEQVNNGEYLITAPRLASLLDEGGMIDVNDWGRADLEFTFYSPGYESIKSMDMDRLLNTGGVFANYGDNGNDAFSLKARSCDDGRFGSHVANKLEPAFEYFLVGICGIGELDRDLDSKN